jgi:DNA-binding transcriptional regulator GbsR (MarR family)
MNASDQTLPDLFADVAQVFGLSRPAGQCFAAIWRAAGPPCADDLVRTLGLSRSNVSNALKELRGWNLIGIARTPGDRKEYFTAPPDPWDLVGRLIAARQRHVVAPLLDRVMTAEAASADVRLAALHDVLRTVGAAFTALAGSDGAELALRFGQLGSTDEKQRKKKKKK